MGLVLRMGGWAGDQGKVVAAPRYLQRHIISHNLGNFFRCLKKMAVAGRNAFLLGQKTSDAAIRRALTLRLWRHNRRSTPRIDQKNKVLVPYISNRNDDFYQKMGKIFCWIVARFFVNICNQLRSNTFSSTIVGHAPFFGQAFQTGPKKSLPGSAPMAPAAINPGRMCSCSQTAKAAGFNGQSSSGHCHN